MNLTAERESLVSPGTTTTIGVISSLGMILDASEKPSATVKSNIVSNIYKL